MERIRIARPPFYYGWLIVAAGMLLQLHLAWPPNTIGIFLNELELEFGWGRAAVSSVTLFSGVGYVIFNLLGGWLTDKYGPRLPIILGAIITTIAVILTSRVNSLAQFYFLYVISGATGFVFPIAGSITQRWFRTRRRGLALGLVTAGSPVGGLIYPLLVNWVTINYGWRTGYLAIAAMIGSLFLVAAFLIVASPEKMGLQPYGAASPGGAGQPAGKRAARPDEPVWTIKQAFGTMTYPLLILTSLLTVIPQIMVSVHIIPFAGSIGISRTAAAAALGIKNFVGIIGSIIIGGFADRLGWKRGLVILTALSGLSMFWLMSTRSPWMLWVYVIFAGVCTVGRGPLTSGLLGTYFGIRSLTTLIAVNNITSTIGGALGPAIGGLLYERTGSYFVPFLIGAILLMAAAALFAIMKAPRKKAMPSVATVAGG